MMITGDAVSKGRQGREIFRSERRVAGKLSVRKTREVWVSMTRMRSGLNPSARADLQAAPYRRRKARKFRTWTFSAGAILTREIREGRRGNCYPEVAKHASSARAVSVARCDSAPFMRMQGLRGGLRIFRSERFGAENFRSQRPEWYGGVSQ